MKLGSQIKKYRKEEGLSQEDLAQKVFVSRQSVSNWENGKTYPDIKSLLLLSEAFSVSLDLLIKGDVESMKREIDSQAYAKFQRDSLIFTVLFVAMLLLPIPMLLLDRWWGIAIYVLISAAGLYYAIKVEKYKKKHDIQTYREIVAFTEGKTLNEIEKARETGKRPYQKILLALGSALLAVLVAVVISAVLRYFGLINAL